MEFSLGVAFALLALPPVLLWLLFWRRQFRDKEPGCVLFQLFFFGVFAAIPLFMLREYLTAFPEQNFLSFISSTVLFIILFAVVEELVKGLALIAGVELNRQWFDRLEDGFEYALAVALGFSFAENVMYFLLTYLDGGLSTTFWQTYAIRSTVTTLGHVLFTGAFGFAYAVAYLRLSKSQRDKPLAGLSATFRRPLMVLQTTVAAFTNKSVAKFASSSLVVAGGFLIAVMLHTGFNLLWELNPAGYNLGIFTLPLAIVVAYFYIQKLRKLPIKKGRPEKA